MDYGCYCVLFIYPEKNGKDEIGGLFVDLLLKIDLN